MNRARLEGQLEGRQELVLRLLKRRVGNLSIDLETRVRSLPPERLEALGEALLDFTQMEDAIMFCMLTFSNGIGRHSGTIFRAMEPGAPRDAFVQYEWIA
jgi:Domain of unknown function (DUF4351)